MNKERAAIHIAELARRWGADEVKLDEHGMVMLAIDDGALIVHIGHNPHTGTLDLMLCLDEIVPSGAQLVRLLAANFGWVASRGATFAVEPGTGALVLQRRLGSDDLPTGGLAAAVESLVGTAGAWAKRLVADGSATADEPAETPDGLHMVRA